MWILFFFFFVTFSSGKVVKKEREYRRQGPRIRKVIMTPTNRNNEEIEGQPYKEYVYSPVPVSSTSAVHHPTTTFTNFYKQNTSKESQCVNNKDYHHQNEKMAEKGSKFLQYLAATTGKSKNKNFLQILSLFSSHNFNC